MAYLGFDPQISSTSYRNIDDISASFDGFVTAFPLRVGGVVPGIAPINEQQVLINVGGVPQQPDPSGVNGFKLSAGNIVFSSAPSIGEKFWGVILASANYISANTRFADGSAGLPSVTFASDVTTGIYSPGAGQLAISAGGTGKLFVNSSGIQVPGDVQASSYNSGPIAGSRNRIINGDMRIDQRNAGASVSSGLGVTTYTADRWSVATSGAAVTVQRQGIAGNYYLNITGAAGNTITNIRQRIEVLNVADLAGRTVTLSFVCSSTTATSVTAQVSCASASDNFATITNTQLFVRTITSTGAAYSATFTMPSQAVNGVEVLFSLTNFTSGIFALADVQLEPGTVATPFERRSYGQELALCQRYFWNANASYYEQAYSPATGGNQYTQIWFPVIMRASPTIAGAWSSGVNASAGLLNTLGPQGAASSIQSVGAGGYAAIINWYTFSAEL